MHEHLGPKTRRNYFILKTWGVDKRHQWKHKNVF